MGKGGGNQAKQGVSVNMGLKDFSNTEDASNLAAAAVGLTVGAGVGFVVKPLIKRGITKLVSAITGKVGVASGLSDVASDDGKGGGGGGTDKAAHQRISRTDQRVKELEDTVKALAGDGGKKAEKVEAKEPEPKAEEKSEAKADDKPTEEPKSEDDKSNDK